MKKFYALSVLAAVFAIPSAPAAVRNLPAVRRPPTICQRLHLQASQQDILAGAESAEHWSQIELQVFVLDQDGKPCAVAEPTKFQLWAKPPGAKQEVSIGEYEIETGDWAKLSWFNGGESYFGTWSLRAVSEKLGEATDQVVQGAEFSMQPSTVTKANSGSP